MMIIVAILAETGIFQYVAVRASKASKANYKYGPSYRLVVVLILKAVPSDVIV